MIIERKQILAKLKKYLPKKLSRKKKIFTSLLALFVLIILLVTAEAFSVLIIKRTGYLWEPAYLRMIKGYKTSHMYGSRTEDHSWGQWSVPNFSGNVVNQCMDFKITFNQYGARDKDRNKSGKSRTLVFGDSFIEGWGVDQDKTLPAYLEKISGKEFLNFGNSGGFSILNEYFLYKDFANEFEHDAIIVGLTVGNDFDDNNAIVWGGNAKIFYRPFWKLSDDKTDVEVVYYAPFVKGKYVPGNEPRKEEPAKLYENWKDFSAFLNLARFVKDHAIYFSKESQGAKKFSYDLNYSDDAITAVVLLYDKLAKLVQDKKKYVVILPSATDTYYYLNNGKRKAPKMEEFKKKLRDQGWQVVDAIDAYVRGSEDKIPKYFLCDGHPSADGNKLVAEYLYDFIKKDETN